MSLREEIYAWVFDYLEDEQKSLELTGIIMHHVNKSLKSNLVIGLLGGFISLYILIRWLS